MNFTHGYVLGNEHKTGLHDEKIRRFDIVLERNRNAESARAALEISLERMPGASV